MKKNSEKCRDIKRSNKDKEHVKMSFKRNDIYNIL